MAPESKIHIEVACKIDHRVITQANTPDGIKISTFFRKKKKENDAKVVQCHRLKTNKFNRRRCVMIDHVCDIT